MVVVEPIDSLDGLGRMTNRPPSVSVVLFYRPDVTNNITCLNRYYEMANSARARVLAEGSFPVFFGVHNLWHGNGYLQDHYGGPDLPLCVFFLAHNGPVEKLEAAKKISGMDMNLVLKTAEEYARPARPPPV